MSNKSADSERYDLQIAVISDTHNQVSESLPPALAPADENWYLGDVYRPETLNDLNTLDNPPLRYYIRYCFKGFYN